MTADQAAPSVDSDDALIARVRAGDTRAFDELVTRYRDYVYNIVQGIVGRSEEARDITQDVFLQVHRSLHTFRRGARFATWLYRIAVNRAVDAARSRHRWSWLSLDDSRRAAEDSEGAPDAGIEQVDERGMVQRIMMEIPPRHRDVLVLRYYQDLTIEEIAAVLGCSEQAAKVRLHRARQQFRAKYEALYGKQEH
mgnify:CR=1 FL=1|jgi:RNA polymerase sigma-70 factor (ECF subfamily)